MTMANTFGEHFQRAIFEKKIICFFLEWSIDARSKFLDLVQSQNLNILLYEANIGRGESDKVCWVGYEIFWVLAGVRGEGRWCSRQLPGALWERGLPGTCTPTQTLVPKFMQGAQSTWTSRTSTSSVMHGPHQNACIYSWGLYSGDTLCKIRYWVLYCMVLSCIDTLKWSWMTDVTLVPSRVKIRKRPCRS